MPRITACLAVLALAASPAACLSPPPLAPRRDSGASDARIDARPAGLAVLSVEIRDARGAEWSEISAPRVPTVIVTFSDLVTALDDCLLLDGSSDPELVEDLSVSPLRAATAARRLAVRAEASGTSIALTPETQLAPGAILTLALPAWLPRSDGGRLGAPFTREIEISTDPSAGARATDAWPPDGAFAVPTSLLLAALRFDGDVPDLADVIVLRDAEGEAVDGIAARVDCPALGWETGACAMFRPAGPLAVWSPYAITIRPLSVDATGAPLPSTTASFVTGDGEVPPPLAVVVSSCASDEVAVSDGCVRSDDASASLRLALSGAARIAWSTETRSGTSIAPRGEVTIALDGLPASASIPLALTATDYGGVESELTFELSTTEPLPTVSIVEVRANPAGAEPRQEYVELENYGTEPVGLAGLFLSDSESDGDALPAVVIAPGARALLVTDDFDPDDDAAGRDAAVPAATMLVRLDHSLCSGGLSNSGEPIFLRDAAHHRVSAAPASPPPIEGVCIVRASESMRTGETGAFEYDPLGTCTPGR